MWVGRQLPWRREKIRGGVSSPRGGRKLEAVPAPPEEGENWGRWQLPQRGEKIRGGGSSLGGGRTLEAAADPLEVGNVGRAV